MITNWIWADRDSICLTCLIFHEQERLLAPGSMGPLCMRRDSIRRRITFGENRFVTEVCTRTVWSSMDFCVCVFASSLFLEHFQYVCFWMRAPLERSCCVWERKLIITLHSRKAFYLDSVAWSQGLHAADNSGYDTELNAPWICLFWVSSATECSCRNLLGPRTLLNHICSHSHTQFWVLSFIWGLTSGLNVHLYLY